MDAAELVRQAEYEAFWAESYREILSIQVHAIQTVRNSWRRKMVEHQNRCAELVAQAQQEAR